MFKIGLVLVGLSLVSARVGAVTVVAVDDYAVVEEIGNDGFQWRFNITHSQRSFEVVATANQNIVAPTARHTAHMGNGETIAVTLPLQHKWLVGNIVGEQSSRVALSWTGKLLYGTLISSVDGGWALEADHRTGRSSLHSQQDMQEEMKGHTCQVHADRKTSDSRRRRKTSAQQSSQHTECDVFLDADHRYYNQWKGICENSESSCDEQLSRVAVRMIDALHQADDMYSANSMGLRLVVAGTHIETTSTDSIVPDNVAEMKSVLDHYAFWLATGVTSNSDGFTAVRGEGTLKSDEVCLNHLFTHYDNDDNVQGFGYQKVICDTESQSIQDPEGVTRSAARNAAFVTSITNGVISSQVLTSRTLAHEIGHNAGSVHDCCASTTECTAAGLISGDQNPCPNWIALTGFNWPTVDNKEYQFDASDPCVPSDWETQGGYIMFPISLNDGSLTNYEKFSSCSKSDVQDTISEQGGCLRIPDACRNGGDCCNGDGSLKSQGTTCRASDSTEPCKKEAVCDGVHAECPIALNKNDGIPCYGLDDGDECYGECLSGQCVSIHSGACSEGYGEGCPASKTSEDYECVEACISSAVDQCIPTGDSCPFDSYEGLIFTTPSPKSGCPMAASGSPCLRKGQPGTCNGVGKCILDDPCALGGLCCDGDGQVLAKDTPCVQSCSSGLLCDGVSGDCPGLQVDGGISCTTEQGKDGRCTKYSGECDECFDITGELSGFVQSTTCEDLRAVSNKDSLCSSFESVSSSCPVTCGKCTPISQAQNAKTVTKGCADPDEVGLGSTNDRGSNGNGTVDDDVTVATSTTSTKTGSHGLNSGGLLLAIVLVVANFL